MPTLTVRQLDEGTYAGLKRRAEVSGRSMEAEARAILDTVAGGESWWTQWIKAIDPSEGDIPIPPRTMPGQPRDLSWLE
ncbi:MAG: toxin-antitoxin system antitoxin subunit [Propionibacteriaceae bacterium]|nr:toxin-antitoxin system antitoxin subunit [Propionibacteriaceae bacterium]